MKVWTSWNKQSQSHCCRVNRPHIVHLTLDLAFANNVLLNDPWSGSALGPLISLWWKTSLPLEGVRVGDQEWSSLFRICVVYINNEHMENFQARGISELGKGREISFVKDISC